MSELLGEIKDKILKAPKNIRIGQQNNHIKDTKGSKNG